MIFSKAVRHFFPICFFCLFKLQILAQGSFVGSVDIFLTGNPVAITHADFDENGIVDFAVAEQNPGSISVFLADGRRGYLAPITIELTNQVASLISADITNDGYIDIIYTSTTSNAVHILVGDGNGYFTSNESILVGDSPRELVVTNVNGDEFFDIVTSNHGSDNISVLLSDSALAFTRMDFAVGDGPRSIVYMDFNNDSSIDLAVANSISDDVTLLIGDGIGGFVNTTSFATGDNPQKIRSGDFNDDGYMDLISANQLSNQVHLMYGDGNNNLLDNFFMDTPNNPVDLTVGHFNEDELLDVVSLNSGNSSISLFTGNESGNLNAARNFRSSGNALEFDLVDLNSDTILDIILVDFASSKIQILYGGRNAQFGPQINGITSSAYFPQGIVSGDFNGDGFDDIAISHDPIINRSVDQVSIFLNDGNGRFGGRHLFKNVGENPQDLEVTDFNNDGILDLISAVGRNEVVAILIGDGTGDFETATISNSGGARELAIGHLNEDEFIDIVGTYSSSGIIVFFGDGIDGELSRLIINTGGYSNDVTIADVNEDGLNDIIASNCCTSNNSKVSVIINEGGGDFRTPYSILDDTDPEKVEVADINNDGHADLVVMGNSRDVSVLLGDGQGGFALSSTIRIDYTRGLKLVDITGDGNIDILVSDINTASIYQGDGLGQFDKLSSYNAGGQAQFITTADFNNDQKIDFALSNATTNDFFVYLNNTNSDVTPPQIQISADLDSLETTEAIEVTIAFSEEVRGFDSTDLFIENGAISGDLIRHSNLLYAVSVIPITTGNLNLSIKDNMVSDSFGNGNLHSNIVRIPVILNHPPVDIQLDNNSVRENQPAGILVGLLNAVDSDEEDLHTYSFVSGPGSENNDQFTLTDNMLTTAGVFNFETDSVYSIRIQTNDGNEGILEKSFAIEVVDINDNPSDIYVSDLTIDENAADGTVIGILSTIDEDSLDVFSYSLQNGSGDADNDQFYLSNNELISALPYDFESKSSYSVRIRTDDGNGGSFEKPFTIRINDINDFPSNVLLDNNTIRENQPISQPIGMLSTVDEDIADQYTYSFVEGDGDSFNDQFSISGYWISSNASFDFEKRSDYSIRVSADDGNGNILEKPFTIQIIDVNEPPTDIRLDNSTIEENQDTGSLIGLLTAIDEDIDDLFQYQLVAGAGDSDNGNFNIVENQLVSALSFDFETESTYQIRLSVQDSHGSSFEKPFVIEVSDSNDSPSDMLLSNRLIDENLGTGTLVGSLLTTDADLEDGHTYTLINGPGDQDNEYFSLSDNHLLTANSFDFESKPIHSIRVLTDDGNGGTFEKSFEIQVVDGNDIPSDLSLSNKAVEENESPNMLVGRFNTSDEDKNDAHVYAFVEGVGDVDNTHFIINGDELLTANSFDFESQSTLSIRLSTTDARGAAFEKSFNIEIIDKNDSPLGIELSNNTLLENQPKGTFIGDFTSLDEDEGDTHKYTLTVDAVDTDNSKFTIENDQLLSNAEIDFETESLLLVQVSTTDGEGEMFTRLFEINVLDVEEIVTAIEEANDVTIYPNPSHKTFQIKWTLSERISLQVYGQKGVLIDSQEGDVKAVNDWLLSRNFRQGVILVKISSKDYQLSKKVVIH